MPDPDTIALRRSKILREQINSRTGINDLTVTDGVKRLLRSSGNEVVIRHEAAMMLDVYPDPVIIRENPTIVKVPFDDDFSVYKYSITEEDRYIRLAYLENVEKSYINTGYIPNILTDTGEIEFEVMDTATYTKWPGIAMIQTRSDGNGANFGTYYYTSGQGIGYGDNRQNYVGKHYNLTFQSGSSGSSSFTFDGDNVTGNLYVASINDTFSKPLTLFFRNNNSDSTSYADGYGKVRLFRLKINRNGTPFHNYIPKEKQHVKIVENLDTGETMEFVLSSIIGYHDEVDDVFFTNDGSGSFVKGPVIN